MESSKFFVPDNLAPNLSTKADKLKCFKKSVKSNRIVYKVNKLFIL